MPKNKINNFHNYLAVKLDVQKHRIKKHNIKYYYTKWPELCCRYRLKDLNNGIDKNDDKYVGPYQFNKAMKNLNGYYHNVQCDYYKNLSETSAQYPDGESLIGKETNETLDHIVSEYIRFRENTFVITLWPNATKMNNINKLLELLYEHGHVYYIKKINLHRTAAQNLIYQLYSDTHRLSTLDKIKEKLDYIGWEKDAVMSIKVIVFEHNSTVPISGSMAPLKQMIRDIFVKNQKGTKLRGDDFVHINDNFFQTIEYTKIFFNKNSLKALHFQDLNNHLDKSMGKGRVYMNTVKKWIIENVHPYDQDRFIFMGSTVLYAYGIRVCRDVDGLVSPRPELNDSKTPFFLEKIRKSFYEKSSKFFFADIGVQDTALWKNSWDVKDKKWFDLIGIKHRDELIFDPKNYFYFNGIKMVTLLINVKRRVLRKKVTDYGDLFETMRKTNITIDFSKLPVSSPKKQFLKELHEYMAKKYKHNHSYYEKINELVFIS
jgi:hypothetical protein